MIETKCSFFKTSFSLLLNQCKSMKELKKIHAQILKSPNFSETDRYFLTTRLLFFCAISEAGSLPYATKVFNNLGRSNLYVYNALIRAYSSKLFSGQSINSCPSLTLYVQMLRNGISPDNLTFPFILKECTRRVDCLMGLSVYSQVVKSGFHDDVYIQNCMISLLCECGFIGCAQKLFDEMPERDVVSWNSMIVGCLRNGELDLALCMFRRMAKRSIYTWNSMITGFVQAGKSKVALELFQEMESIKDDVRPDKITLASVLSACASLGAIHYGSWVYDYLKRRGLQIDMVTATALIDMYGKCGHVNKAIETFRGMPKKDVLAWTAMISVYALHGYGNEALDLLKEMELQEVKPNHVTFVGLLSACAHAGLVEEGRRCFEMMTCVYSIEPCVYHYACMVDILSRAALFDEAEKLINGMPMEPDAFVWGALLGGCQMHKNVELGEKVAIKLINLDPLNHAFYINLCDIYAKGGRFNDVKKIRTFMQEKGIIKDLPGSSMIEVDGVVREFSVRGSPELVMDELVWLLHRLNNKMKIGSQGNDLDDI
ncbi:pentatricopeptide repeat-containing protein At5g66520 [Beta vulgaris subsp. vulgaris]|uniref:pentatricopeptide repeat-containing protein At5g66520 n=1 Tax=Beta vulgaris subsp. vulgaris TaxID=3555 RepID=UPI0020374C8C|nr:pentatricopeptide repeat-containing protein At5g66520 [Beta vulgaris subsp. vulgaris]XP_010693655.2 pentatricopeptide repeat-containing protein At5g66520 [Beta vulgaris subsp. vulgaris]XP_010693657.2 pentatricopeptide repeat-containing protein At5g66520 [Beta vulgaris subsp. vulgaris]XP_019107964.2 pentatricopeptide repeat-containing protein At5g66520 [Beta vulgaris subsp. vulgaris]XP_057249558.1 pentatricopeptide repeat-containing protein At5g66520 [Beta vulgaris subsp. vulgaris]